MADQTSGDTGPQQITVEQLAAQLSRKALPGARGSPPQGGTPNPPDPGTTPADEAPAGEATGTEPNADLSQPASTPETTGDQPTEGDDTAPLREQQTQAEVTPEPGPGDEQSPHWHERRVAKLTTQKKELQERLAAAEKLAEEATAKLEDAKRASAGGKTKAWNHAEQQLQEQLQGKRDILRWAEENSQGATLHDEKGTDVEYSAEQIRAIKLSALEDIGDLRGQLRDHQGRLSRDREFWDAEAVQAYPTLKDPDSEESRNIELMLHKLPWLREVPDARISLADMLAGRAARVKKAKTPTPPAKPAIPTRVPTTPSATPARIADGEPSKELKQANETFQQTGRTEDLARRFSLQRKV